MIQQHSLATEQKLLEETLRILRKADEADRTEARSYNIFHVAGIATDEVRGHSAMIANLLDPRGSHGQGNLFLQLFFDHLRELATKRRPGANNRQKFWGLLSGRDWDASMPWTVKTEAWTRTLAVEDDPNNGEGAEDKKEERRRADIYLLLPGELGLVIENKIYATDQHRQLERYLQHARLEAGDGNAFVLYLTLRGKEPQGAEGKLANDEFGAVSYKDLILPWIQECIRTTASIPRLNDVLKQYGALIHDLVERRHGRNMNMDVADLINNKEMLRAAGAIARVLPQRRAKIHESFWLAFKKRSAG